ncbi:MAG TPA: TIGR02678 family protein [Myxococcaceae bacterium]|nr:TIGR02678 family protein [Myxococcaceae bacterium]
MSELKSVLESQRGSERAAAVRRLLASPLVLAADEPEAFGSILRHREWLSTWFADHPGWKLVVEPAAGFARLHKVPAVPEATRPAHAPGRPAFDRRRYALLCLTLAVLDDVASQTTLARLAALVEEASAEEEGVSPFEPTSASERRAFVDALRLLGGLGVLRLRDGDAERYAQNRDGDALFDVNERLLSHLVSAPVPPALASGPERLLDEPWPDTEDGQRQRARQHVLRRLLDEPVVYFEDLDPRAFDWFDHSRGFVYRLLHEDAGFTVERRKEGLAAVDPAGETTDTLFPDGGSTLKHAALLLMEQLARLYKRGESPVRQDVIERLVRQLQRDQGELCHWSKQYSADEPGSCRLAVDALELLEGFGLVSRTEDGTSWRVRPAAARFAAGAPTARRKSAPRR